MTSWPNVIVCCIGVVLMGAYLIRAIWRPEAETFGEWLRRAKRREQKHDIARRDL